MDYPIELGSAGPMTKLVADIVAWVRARAGKLATLAGGAAILFVIYLLTNSTHLYSTSVEDYPFGSDVPMYSFGQGAPQIHPLMVKVLLMFGWIGQRLHLPETPLEIKAPYALFGAANFVLAVGAFAAFFGKFGYRAILYGACYALTLIVWFFASVPESYSLTTLFYTSYLLVFLHAARAKLTPTSSIALAFVFFIALNNDISFIVFVCVPLFYYGRRIFTEPAPRLAAVVHVLALAAYLANNLLRHDLIGTYMPFLQHYTPVGKSDGLGYDYLPQEPAFNFFFASLGAPTPDTPRAPWHDFPHYHGFFQPTLFGYFGSAVSIAFLASYAWVLSFIRLSRVNRLVLALFAFVLIRFALAWAFNPVESMLYTSVSMLALLICLFHFLETSQFRHKNLVASVFLLTLFGANLRYFAAPIVDYSAADAMRAAHPAR